MYAHGGQSQEGGYKERFLSHKINSNVKSMSDANASVNNFQGGNGNRVININKLNINIQ